MRAIRIDKVGRIVIPKAIRDQLGFKSGDSLDVITSGDEIILRPVRETIPIRKEDGVWVYRSGEPVRNISIRDLIAEVREERMRRIVGFKADC